MKYYELFKNMTDAEAWFPEAPYDSKGKKLEIEMYDFTHGKKNELIDDLRTYLYEEGGKKPVDFSSAGAFDVPLISERLAEAFMEIAKDEIQLNPIVIEGVKGNYFLLNAVSCIDCIDYENSKPVVYYGNDIDEIKHYGNPKDFKIVKLDKEQAIKALDSLKEYYNSELPEFADKIDVYKYLRNEKYAFFLKGSDKYVHIGDSNNYRLLKIDEKKAEGHNIFRLKDKFKILIVSDKIKKMFKINEFTGAHFINTL